MSRAMAKPIVLILAVGLVVWGNTLFNSFVWDDQAQITNNALVHSMGNIPEIFRRSTFGTPQTSFKYYRPMMSSVFAGLYSIVGDSPAFFHLFQILLHSANAILVFLLLKSFFDKRVALI